VSELSLNLMTSKLILLVDRDAAEPEINWLIATAKIQPYLQTILSQTSTVEVETLTIQDLTEQVADTLSSSLLYPLTLQIPPKLALAHLYQQCQDSATLRQQVADWGYRTGTGCCWLPIALTAKGPLYGEVIGLLDPKTQSLAREIKSGSQNPGYCQPVHLQDAWRQPLYALGQRLLHELAATPATYLLQFGWQGQDLCFDRLWPFPTQAAIASLGVQDPDLFISHWRCLANLPILDLEIDGSANVQVMQLKS
jgi:hypothetical protein